MPMKQEPVCLLGGGLSALAFAHFYGGPAVIFEKEDRLGGLCRSFETNGVCHDVGPHIFFSKEKEILDFLTSLTPMNRLRRSNKIFYEGRFVKYPFENELSALPEKDRDWCLETFIDNPHRDRPAENMLAFFLKTFGEGITRAYLEPYNRKIWKFDPARMDTQMVERIPNPPPEDIIASARGEATEGYLHQLYFSYPVKGGTEAIIRALAERSRNRTEVHLSSPLESLRVNDDGSFRVSAAGRTRDFRRVVSTIPLDELFPRLDPPAPPEVTSALEGLKYNSIHITIIQTARHSLGANLAVMVPDPEISFHRVTRLDFFGENYRLPGYTTLMAEITFRPGDPWDLPDDEISEMVVNDLDRLGFSPRSALKAAATRTYKYAYVIYDLDHRKNTGTVLSWLRSSGLESIGRFGAFEYINMNTAVEQARECAIRLKAEGGLR